MKISIVSMSKVPQRPDYWSVVLRYSPSRWEALFGKKAREVEVFGSSTVWHNAETGARMGTSIEMLLSGAVALAEHKEIVSG